MVLDTSFIIEDPFSMKKIINQTYGLFYQKTSTTYSEKVKAVSILMLISILTLVIFIKIA